MQSDSDFERVTRTPARLFVWFIVLSLTVFPASGFVAGLILRKGWRFSELNALWMLLFLGASSVLYVSIDADGRRRPWTVLLLLLALSLGYGFVVPTLFGTIDRGKQNRAIGEIRVLASAASALCSTAETPSSHLSCDFDTPQWDPWGACYHIACLEDGYTVTSHGEDRRPDPPGQKPRGATNRLEEDIVLRNGEFVQWPQGLR